MGGTNIFLQNDVNMGGTNIFLAHIFYIFFLSQTFVQTFEEGLDEGDAEAVVANGDAGGETPIDFVVVELAGAVGEVGLSRF